MERFGRSRVVIGYWLFVIGEVWEAIGVAVRLPVRSDTFLEIVTSMEKRSSLLPKISDPVVVFLDFGLTDMQEEVFF